MISVQEAIELVAGNTVVWGTESVPLLKALGRILAEPAIAQEEQPLFDSSAVDGYAVRLSDLQEYTQLRVMGESQAGSGSLLELEAGAAMRIFTGARIPTNAQAVIMQEYSLREDTGVSFQYNAKLGENIRRRGEEYSIGDIVLQPGCAITPSVLAMLATLNYDSVLVYKQPRISLVITGNEVKLPGEQLLPGEIRDSNSYAMIGAMQSLGIAPHSVRRVKDDPEEVERVLRNIISESDVVIITGGISVGDHDHVRWALQQCGVEEMFWKVKMKPGKPVYFGRMNDKLIFALPGNPVAVMVAYQLFVKQSILLGMGSTYQKELRTALLTQCVKSGSREEFVRGVSTINDEDIETVLPLKGQGSHMVGGMAKANCLIVIPEEITEVSANSIVNILPVTWTAYS